MSGALAAPGAAHATRVHELSDRVTTTLTAVVGSARDVALLDFPTYRNAGDSAIWTATKRMFTRLGIRVRYQAADLTSRRAPSAGGARRARCS